VDAVRAQVGQSFGVGGLTLPEGGFPVASELLAAELVRLGADFTFLRRSFTADMAGRDPFAEVPRLLEAVAGLGRARPSEIAERRARFVLSVTGREKVSEPAPVLAPTVVALPA
jgi:hypothetical protein